MSRRHKRHRKRNRPMKLVAKIRFVNSLIALDRQPGDAKYITNSEDKVCRLHFVCPGCKEVCGITIKPAEPDGWDIEGPNEAPTTSPSIKCGCSWHGWLVKGEFVE